MDWETGNSPELHWSLSREEVQHEEEDSVERAGAPIAFMRLLAIVCLCFLVVNAGFEQLQMWFYNGQVEYSSALIKVALMAILVLTVLLRGRLSESWVLGPTLFFIAYLAFDSLYLISARSLSVKDVLQSYNGYYGLLLIAVLARPVGVRISEKLIVRVVLILFAVSAFLAIAQYIVNDPIVPTQSADGLFSVQVWNRAPHIRVFSLFSAPDLLGCFAAFIAALAVSISFERGKRLWGILLLLIAVFICFSTIVRTALLQCAFTVATALAFRFVKVKLWHRLLPVVWLFLGGLALVFAFFRSQSGGVDASLTDTSTFVTRLYEWRYYLGQFFSASTWDKVLGLGIFQGGHVDTSSVVPVDNIYIVALVHIGIVGLVATVALLWAMLNQLIRLAEETMSPLVVAAASFWSVVWVTGLTQNFTFYFASIFLLVSLSSADRSANPVPDAIVTQAM